MSRRLSGDAGGEDLWVMLILLILARRKSFGNFSGCFAYQNCLGSFKLHTHHVPCGDDSFRVFPSLCGVPTVQRCVCLGQCERDGNGWVTRDKNVVRTGEMLVTDSEHGTHATYSLKCCSDTFQEKPCCGATRVKGCRAGRTVEIKDRG